MKNMNIIYIPEIDSTSSELHRQLRDYDLPHGYCIITDYQTDGYGQASNRWESDRAQNLLFSLLLRPHVIDPSEQFVITEIVTLSILRALQPEISEEITVKWPNDIYVRDRKLCGMLIENTLCGHKIDSCIVGIGINVNQTEFRSEAPNPISLGQISGHGYDRAGLLKPIIENILALYDDLVRDNTIGFRRQLHDYYLSHLYRRTGYHSYKTPSGQPFLATIHDITPQGLLVLRDEEETFRHYAYKEVIFLPD